MSLTPCENESPRKPRELAPWVSFCGTRFRRADEDSHGTSSVGFSISFHLHSQLCQHKILDNVRCTAANSRTWVSTEQTPHERQTQRPLERLVSLHGPHLRNLVARKSPELPHPSPPTTHRGRLPQPSAQRKVRRTARPCKEADEARPRDSQRWSSGSQIVRLMVESLQRRNFDVAVACVTDVHFHILARFRDHNPRHWIGIAKKSRRTTQKQNPISALKADYGPFAPQIPPDADRGHQIKSAKYIYDHLKQGGAVWSKQHLLAPRRG